MRTDWKYEVLFAFKLRHPAANIHDFEIQPTAVCRKRMKRFGLLFKAKQGGEFVLIEKKINANDVPQVIRPVRELTAFTFLLFLNKPALLLNTRLYDQNASTSLVGRSPIIYLDNLDDNNIIDGNVEFHPANDTGVAELGTMPLSVTSKVSNQDVASIIPNQYTYYVDSSITNEFIVESIKPGEPWMESYFIAPEENRVDLSLPTGAFRIRRPGLPGEQTVFADTALLPTRPFGVIQIHKDQNIEYNRAIRYDIVFENP